ncbi:MAG: flagellar protein FlaG [Lysobacteraceae bacterium]
MPDIAPLPAVAATPAPAGVATPATATPVPPAIQPAPTPPAALREQLAVLAPPASTHLRFHVEEELGCIAVSVIDERSGEVIMQVPSEAALRIARRLHAGGSLVDDHA